MTERDLLRVARSATARLETAGARAPARSTHFCTRLVEACALGILLILPLLSACSHPSSPRSELLGQSYRDIQQSYIWPMPAREQALSSLNQLTVVDDELSFRVSADQLVLERRAKALSEFDAPASQDWRGWGETVAAVAAAAGVSPAIGKLPRDAIDATLIEGTLTKLDKYSRYLSPEMLSLASSPERRVQFESPADGWNRQGLELESRNIVSQSNVVNLSPSVRISTDRGIALIRIDQFTSKTGNSLRVALGSRRAISGLRGMILDLRDNPGGDFDGAVTTARLFLQHGIIVSLEARDPSERQIVRADRQDQSAPVIPLIVLIDGSSASSAEIVAAALQENGRALVVGSPSFGKGTVQTIFTLDNGGELWVTSAFSRTPAGYLLQGHGVVPDVCASLFANSQRSVRAQFQALAGRPRLSLTEAEWARLRMLCPDVSPSQGDVAVRLARQLILHRESRWSRLER